MFRNPEGVLQESEEPKNRAIALRRHFKTSRHEVIGASQFSKKRLSAPAVKHIWRGIEVVITGLTRNQFGSNPTRVRIPPSPPQFV